MKWVRRFWILVSGLGLIVALLLVVTRSTTSPQIRASSDFDVRQDLRLAVIGDSILTDMIRAHSAPLDAYRLLFPTRQNAITAKSILRSDQPQSLFEYLQKSGPLEITNYSRPGAHLFVRDWADDPPAWQRWILNIPNLKEQINWVLENPPLPDLFVFWTSHMEPLNWNDAKRLRSQNRLPLSATASDDELRALITNEFGRIFKEEILRLHAAIQIQRPSQKTALVVFGLFNWSETNSLNQEIMAAKSQGVPGYEQSEPREDPQGSLKVWTDINQTLRTIVKMIQTQESDHLRVYFSDQLETAEFELEDVEADGIHPTPQGQAKIAFRLYEGLQPALEYLDRTPTP